MYLCTFFLDPKVSPHQLPRSLLARLFDSRFDSNELHSHNDAEAQRGAEHSGLLRCIGFQLLALGYGRHVPECATTSSSLSSLCVAEDVLTRNQHDALRDSTYRLSHDVRLESTRQMLERHHCALCPECSFSTALRSLVDAFDSSPLSLMQLARISIRYNIVVRAEDGRGNSFHESVRKLPLPPVIQRYVLEADELIRDALPPL